MVNVIVFGSNVSFVLYSVVNYFKKVKQLNFFRSFLNYRLEHFNLS